MNKNRRENKKKEKHIKYCTFNNNYNIYNISQNSKYIANIIFHNGINNYIIIYYITSSSK